MGSSWRVEIILALFLLLQLQFTGHAIASTNVYVVYMGEATHSDHQLIIESHHEILSDILGSRESATDSILYSYKHGFSGFAATLTAYQAALIADVPGVIRVVPHRILKLHTTRSWDFLQVNTHIVDGILSKGQSGFGSIIGIMDTGIWPESKSFHDADMEEVPSRWRGICQEGEEFGSSNCNRKIIGARWYVKGYEAEFGKLDTSGGFEFLSPRDASGHGTHTASTTAGSMVRKASFRGLAQGTARGGAPLAWLAIYKVCWATGGCSSADLLAAFDDAISDGVDLLSVSLGLPLPLLTYVDDVLSIGSFHAVAKGIPVICSAGNAGPYPQTVINTAPWVITVAANTIDRAFRSEFTLGNNQTLVGQSLYTGNDINQFYPIVNGEDIASANANEDDARGCDSKSLNKTLVRGKVVLCFETQTQRSVSFAAMNVQEAQGIGVIFAQFPSKDVSLSSGIQCVQVDFIIGTYVLTYIETSSNPIVKLGKTSTTIGRQTSPEVALFSARGPSSLSPTVLKPDIAAPGVNILAAWPPVRSSYFKIESGTSMACPHISSVVALLKSIRPTWSPAAIKSALVTTASEKDEYGHHSWAEGAPHKQADPFDYGGGHVNSNKALDPGLIFDMKTDDYFQFLCSMGYNDTSLRSVTKSPIPCLRTKNLLLNLNLPSISIPELKRKLTISRAVTNVGPAESVYTAHVKAPPGIKVEVEPSTLYFNSTRKKMKFKVTFNTIVRVQGSYSFGYLFWVDGLHVVKIPLVIRPVIESFYAVT